MKSSKDEANLLAFRRGGKELEEAMIALYQNPALWQGVLAFVQRMGGTREDAEDIFQDGIRVLISQVRAGKDHIQGELAAYLMGICRHLWYKKRARQQKAQNLRTQSREEEIVLSDPEYLLVQEDQKQKLETLLERLPKGCRQVLIAWQMGYSMREIAAQTGYKSEGVVRKKKHQCMQKLLKILEKEPIWKNILGKER
jgi:RNA polymerase sigma factor (sigma-70 family)